MSHHSPNYDFIVDTAADLLTRPDAKVLDFGCGRGTMLDVATQRAPHLDFLGADTFEGTYRRWLENVPAALRDRVSRIQNERLPFADGAFDAVVSNQVFEHIADPAPWFDEVARVLRPGGFFLVLFPPREVWFEGHVGLYFAHRIENARLQEAYLRTMRQFGFGYYTHVDKSPHGWARHMHRMLRSACFYHRGRDIEGMLRKSFDASPESLAVAYMRYRLRKLPRLRAVLDAPGASLLNPFLTMACGKRAGLVLKITKQPA